MTGAEIREEVLDILESIAPDEDLSQLDDSKSFREQLELDSMDFLDIVMELRKRHRVQIPVDSEAIGAFADRQGQEADAGAHRQLGARAPGRRGRSDEDAEAVTAGCGLLVAGCWLRAAGCGREAAGCWLREAAGGERRRQSVCPDSDSSLLNGCLQGCCLDEYRRISCSK